MTAYTSASASVEYRYLNRQLKHVTEWQDRKSAIIVANLHHLNCRDSIACNVPMTEHDALWLACRSRRKDKLGQVIAIDKIGRGSAIANRFFDGARSEGSRRNKKAFVGSADHCPAKVSNLRRGHSALVALALE